MKKYTSFSLRKLSIFLFLAIVLTNVSYEAQADVYNQVSSTCTGVYELRELNETNRESVNGQILGDTPDIVYFVLTIADVDSIEFAIDVLEHNFEDGDSLIFYKGHHTESDVKYTISGFHDDIEVFDDIIIDSSVVSIEYHNLAHFRSELDITWQGILATEILTEDNCSTGDNLGSAEVNITSTATPINLLWDSGETSNKREGLVAGIYPISISDAAGCIFEKDIEIFEPNSTILSATETAKNDVCFGMDDGTITISGTGGFEDYSYSYMWHDGSTDPNRADLSAGIYNYTVTDSIGCVYSDSIIIRQPSAPLKATASIVDKISCNVANVNGGATNSDGELTVDDSKGWGVSISSYAWSPSGGSGKNSTPLGEGDYYCVITDAKGCIDTSNTISLTEPTKLNAVASKIKDISCNSANVGNNSDGELVVEAYGGVSSPLNNYLWNDGSATTNDTATSIGVGSYFCVVLDSNNCKATSNTLVLKEPTKLVAIVSKIKDISCNNANTGTKNDGELVVEVYGGASSDQDNFNWNIGGLPNNDTVIGLVANAYNCEVTDTNGCSNTSNSIDLLEPDELIALAQIVDSVPCNSANIGSKLASLSANATGGTGDYTYKWLTEFNSNSDTLVNAGGTFSCTVLDDKGCTDVTNVLEPLEPPLLEIVDIDSTDYNGYGVSCFGKADGGIKVLVEGGHANYSYSWGANANYQAGDSAGSLSAGIYNVTITDNNGCELSDTYTINSPQQMVYDTTITNVKNLGGDDGKIVISNIENDVIGVRTEWSGTGVTQDDLTQDQLIAGFYSVVIIDSNQCTATGTFEVTEPSATDGGGIDLSGTSSENICWSNQVPIDFISTSIAFKASDNVIYAWEHNYNDTGWVEVPLSDALTYSFDPNDSTYVNDILIRRRADKMKKNEPTVIDKTAYSNVITLSYLENKNPDIYNLADSYCSNADSAFVIGLPSGGSFSTTSANSVNDLGNSTAWFIPDSVVLPSNDPYSVTVTYSVDESGCVSKKDSIITINPIPHPYFTLNNQYSNTANADEIDDYRPLGGYFTGQGVITDSTRTTFNPQQLSVGTYNITYIADSSYGCSAQYTRVVGIVSGTGNIFISGTNENPEVFCYDGDTVWLEAEPSRNFTDGKFELPCVYENDTLCYFIPSVLGSANEETIVPIYYNYNGSEGSFGISTSIKIYNVSGKADILDLDNSYCKYGQTVAIHANDLLLGEGGQFFGPDGLLSNTDSLLMPINSITPTVYGAIPDTLTYVYTHSDARSACTDTVWETFSVYALDSVGFITKDTFNISDDPILIDNRIPKNNGEEFTGNVIVNNFEYSPTTLGVDVITLTYKNNNTQCINSYAKPVYVDTTRGVFAGVDLNNIYCFKGQSDTISASATNGIAGSGIFTIDGNALGIEPVGTDSLIIHPSLLAKDSNRIITYTYTGIDGINTYQSTKQIYIDDVGTLRISNLNDMYCSYDGATEIKGEIETAGGTYLYRGDFTSTDGSLFNAIANDGIAQLTPSNAAIGANSSLDVTVTFTYESQYSGSSCTDFIDSTTTIFAPPVLTFDLPAIYNRNGGETVELELYVNYTGGDFSGNSAINKKGIFTPANVVSGVSDVTIRYDYTEPSTGCASTITDNTKVLKSSGNIGGMDETLCYESVNKTIEANVLNTEGEIVHLGFSGMGITDSIITDESAYLNPQDAYDENGDQSLSNFVTKAYYLYGIIINSDTAFFNLEKECTINNVTNISFVLPEGKTEACAGDPYIDLTNTASESGIYELNGTVIENNHFYPTALNVGENIIDFVFNNGTCNIGRFDTILVRALPSAEFYFLDGTDTLNLIKLCEGDSISVKGEFLNGQFTDQTFSYPIDGRTDTADFVAPKFDGKQYSFTYNTSDAYCSNSFTKSIPIYNNPELSLSDNIADIKGFCYGSDAITIYGLDDGNRINTGFFSGDGIVDTIPGLSYSWEISNYEPADGYMLYFNYTDANGCSSIIDEEFDIFQLPEVNITGVLDAYCPNDGQITVAGNRGYANSGSGIIFNSTTYTNDIPINLMDYRNTDLQFVYKYVDEEQCVNYDTAMSHIYRLPNVDFSYDNTCIGNPIQFSFVPDPENSDIDYKFLWDFDRNDEDTSVLRHPSFNYTEQRDNGYNVSLKVTNNEGCSDVLEENIDFTPGPIANFKWDLECAGSTVQFQNLTDKTGIDYEWKIDDVIISKEKDPTYAFSEPGVHNVQLKVSELACYSDTSKTIYIRPIVKVTEDQSYIDSFEEDYSGWGSEIVSGEALSSWENTFPVDTAVINSVIDGSKIWITNAIGTYNVSENSAISSPCFDLSEMKKPMVDFWYWTDALDKAAGAVLQYRLENDTTWNVIGKPEEAIGWYNFNAIEGEPGGEKQLDGWTGNSEGWINAKHDLNDLLEETGLVRFRIAFGSDASAIGDGFAIDKFTIKERPRRVLVEHFTNTKNVASSSANKKVNDLVGVRPLDAIDVQYHTGFPEGDPFYVNYPSGPMLRSVYYDVSSVPYTNMNGISNLSFSLSDSESEDQMLNLAMIEPVFDIDLDIEINGLSVSINNKIKATDDIDNRQLQLFNAIVEKEVVLGDIAYQNVLRNFVPSVSGEYLAKNWIAGDSVEMNYNYSIDNYMDSKELIVITFIQDELTKEILQVTTTDTTSVSIPIAIEEFFAGSHGLDFIVYPNPATDKANVLFSDLTKEDCAVKIFNQQGQLVEIIDVNEGTRNILFNTSNYSEGVYFVNYTTNKEQLVKKLIILK